MPAAFSFMKTVVQTRAKGHTATGHCAYVFGDAGTSTLETPIRNYSATDPKERRRVIRMAPPRHYDYRNRKDIVFKGYAGPNGADDAWRDRHEWTRRIEAADGKRTDSRQLRDDILGIPIALVEQGTAEKAVQEYAQEIAHLHRTPVHSAIHLPHKGSRNHHAHVLYAGRKLTADGEAFARRRDRSQDKPELIEQHKALWTQVCRRYGLELDFTPRHPEEAPTPEYRLTARAIATERRAAAQEEGARLNAAVEAVGGAPLPLQEQQALGEASLDLDGLDTAGLLALPRTPATTAARIARHARRSIPAAAPAAEAPRPRPTPAPAMDPGRAPFISRPFAPEPIAVPRARPAPIARVAVPRARPEPAPPVVAPERPHERPVPAPPWEPARTRPRAARAIEAPAPERARPVPAPAIGIPAPVPPWKAVRRWLKRVKTWWPWAGKPPRPALRIDLPRMLPPAPVPVVVVKPDARGGGPSARRVMTPRPPRKRTTQPARTRRGRDFSR